MEGENEEGSIFETVTAILIAVVVVIGALMAWRASVIDDAAGDADYDGLRAAVFAEKTRALNFVNSYESYGNYVTYWRNNRLSQLIGEDLSKASAEETPVLSAQISTANDLADASRPLFESRYLNRDGSYSVQRQIGEMWADASKKRDMNYMNQFNDADQLRSKTLKMLLALMILSIAPILYSLVESLPDRYKKGAVILGSVIAVAGIVLALLVSMNRV
jgi:hypothetical protein